MTTATHTTEPRRTTTWILLAVAGSVVFATGFAVFLLFLKDHEMRSNAVGTLLPHVGITLCGLGGLLLLIGIGGIIVIHTANKALRKHTEDDDPNLRKPFT